MTIVTNTPRPGDSLQQLADRAARVMPATPPNPKKLYGDKKPPLHLLPLAGMIHQSLAHMDGNNKYGFENWNDTPVEKLTYIGAILRHLELWKYGESYARDTGVHNLGAVMACCAILLDAELNGKLIDNTKHSKATCDLLHTAESIVERLNAAQREREAAKRASVEQH
ncbi:dATP/dGTP diphosphohydrolase domain-containing protein [Bradyrhizobium lupini]|uniref:dATP/dGTP diphosphohydrolase domain-containing protein n=1 Tax=Rhizobium lupini TaxID=136996 RepID=UPI0034C5B570